MKKNIILIYFKLKNIFKHYYCTTITNTSKPTTNYISVKVMFDIVIAIAF